MLVFPVEFGLCYCNMFLTKIISSSLCFTFWLSKTVQSFACEHTIWGDTYSVHFNSHTGYVYLKWYVKLCSISQTERSSTFQKSSNPVTFGPWVNTCLVLYNEYYTCQLILTPQRHLVMHLSRSISSFSASWFLLNLFTHNLGVQNAVKLTFEQCLNVKKKKKSQLCIII